MVTVALSCPDDDLNEEKEGHLGLGENDQKEASENITSTSGKPKDLKSEGGTEILDPFDPSRLRLSQDYGEDLGIQKPLQTIPVRKPSKEEWVQTHPNHDFRITTGFLELKATNELFLVGSDLRDELSNESTFSLKTLFVTVNRQGVLFLWPIRTPGADGRYDEWSRSAIEAAMKAKGNWIRIASNMSLGAYEVWETKVEIPDPVWPEIKLGEILRIAFKNHHIDSLSHRVLRELRGEI